MTSKIFTPVRAALALAVTGSLAMATTAWAQQVHKAEVAGAADIAAQVKAGEAVYQTVCLACHQADGKGLPGAFPPLAGSDYLLGGKDLVERSRTPDIMADAAWAIVNKPSDSYSGRFLIDEDVLRESGVTDFDPYAVTPGGPLMPDLFL